MPLPFLVALLLFFCAPRVLATPSVHDDLERQIALLTEELRSSPGDETLLIQRGDLLRRHREWDAAFADLAGVHALRRSQAFVLARTRLFRDLGFLRAATVETDGHLLVSPQDAQVRILRAEILELRGLHARALAGFDRALAELEHPEPDHYIARARIAVACIELGEGAVARALKGLDEGIARLGPIPSLQLAAIELELSRKNFDAALERLTTVSDQSGRTETWLAHRGRILLAAGRKDQALAAYEASLAAIRSLKPKQRRTATIQALEQSVIAALQDIRTPREDKAERQTDPDSRHTDQ